MPVSHSEGSQTCTLSTEHTLSTIAIPGNYMLSIDMSNLANGDTLFVRVKLKIRATGATAVYMSQSISNVQAMPAFVTTPVAALNELVFTIEQTDGVGKSFDWEVIEL